MSEELELYDFFKDITPDDDVFIKKVANISTKLGLLRLEMEDAGSRVPARWARELLKAQEMVEDLI